MPSMALAASLRSSALLLRGFSRGGGLTGAGQERRRNTQTLGVARWCPPLSGAADMRLRPVCRSLFVSCTQAAAKSPLLTPRRSSAAGAPRSCAEEALGWVFSRARRTANLGRLARGHQPCCSPRSRPRRPRRRCSPRRYSRHRRPGMRSRPSRPRRPVHPPLPSTERRHSRLPWPSKGLQTSQRSTKAPRPRRIGARVAAHRIERSTRRTCSRG